jgi:Complex I intermediate-associated protein 30 (CIA30).
MILKHTFLILALLMTNTLKHIIFDFNTKADISNWYVVNDGVMGGVSNGNFTLNKAGNAVFSGSISLYFNGGFSSVRHQFKAINVKNYSKLVLSVKGDGLTYQVRIKHNKTDYYAFTSAFKTTTYWQKVVVDLEDMQPVFRGRQLDMPNFSETKIEAITILVGNKKEEEFRLELDSIYLEH